MSRYFLYLYVTETSELLTWRSTMTSSAECLLSERRHWTQMDNCGLVTTPSVCWTGAVSVLSSSSSASRSVHCHTNLDSTASATTIFLLWLSYFLVDFKTFCTNRNRKEYSTIQRTDEWRHNCVTLQCSLHRVTCVIIKQWNGNMGIAYVEVWQ